MNLAQLCTPTTPATGCENQVCRECTLEQLGTTSCDGQTVRGCYLGLHPACGVTCRSLEVMDCGQLGCMETGGVAACNQAGDMIVDANLCSLFPCSACPAGPGSFFCSGNNVALCAALPITTATCGKPCGCEQLCVIESVQTCSSCATTNALGGATCMP